MSKMTSLQIISQLVTKSEYDPLLAYQIYLSSTDTLDFTPFIKRTALKIGQLLDDNPDYQGGDVWLSSDKYDKPAEKADMSTYLFCNTLDALGLILDVFRNNGIIYYGYDCKTLFCKKNYFLKETPILAYNFPNWGLNNEN